MAIVESRASQTMWKDPLFAFLKKISNPLRTSTINTIRMSSNNEVFKKDIQNIKLLFN